MANNKQNTGILNKSSLIAIFIIIIVVLFIIASSLVKTKQNLQMTIDYNNFNQEAFVVPNTQREVYKPAKHRLLLSSFVDHVTQSLLTYTPYTIKGQYIMVQKYMDSDLLTRSSGFYYGGISDFQRLPVSLFVADKSSTEISELEEKVDEITQETSQEYLITVKGKRRFINNGNISEIYDEQVSFTVKDSMISKTNPYGFVLTKFDLEKIIK